MTALPRSEQREECVAMRREVSQSVAKGHKLKAHFLSQWHFVTGTSYPKTPFVKNAPSLKLVVDFGFWFPGWIFVRAIFLEKQAGKNHRKIHDFQGNFVSKIHSGNFLPWPFGTPR